MTPMEIARLLARWIKEQPWRENTYQVEAIQSPIYIESATIREEPSVFVMDYENQEVAFPGRDLVFPKWRIDVFITARVLPTNSTRIEELKIFSMDVFGRMLKLNDLDNTENKDVLHHFSETILSPIISDTVLAEFGRFESRIQSRWSAPLENLA